MPVNVSLFDDRRDHLSFVNVFLPSVLGPRSLIYRLFSKKYAARLLHVKVSLFGDRRDDLGFVKVFCLAFWGL